MKYTTTLLIIVLAAFCGSASAQENQITHTCVFECDSDCPECPGNCCELCPDAKVPKDDVEFGTKEKTLEDVKGIKEGAVPDPKDDEDPEREIRDLRREGIEIDDPN